MEQGQVLDALDRIYRLYRYIPKLIIQTLERGGRDLALKCVRKEYPRLRMSGGRRTSLQVCGEGIRITKDGDKEIISWEDYLQYVIDRQKSKELPTF